MSGVQKLSRCSRHTSRSICRHSARGSTAARTRVRSIQPVLRDGASEAPPPSAGSGLRLAGTARSRLPSRITNVVSSAASAKRSTRSTRVSVRCVSKSNISSRPGASLCPPRPCAPGIGNAVQTTLLPATPAIWPKRPSGTGNAATRRTMPGRSTRTVSAGCADSAATGSTGFMPFGAGSNGGGEPARSAIRYGRDARGNDSSNCTASYTGSNVRTDRKYR